VDIVGFELNKTNSKKRKEKNKPNKPKKNYKRKFNPKTRRGKDKIRIGKDQFHSKGPLLLYTTLAISYRTEPL
jgi:hypothetical protein